MAGYPSLPLFVKDYLMKTMVLSLEQSGAYLHLLMHAWYAGGELPDDDKALAALCKVSVKKWMGIRPVMEPFWIIQNGVWTNERLSRELQYVKEVSEKRASAGAKGGASRTAKIKELAEAKLEQSLSKAQAPTPTPTPTPSSSLRSEEPQTPDLGLEMVEEKPAEKDRFDEFWLIYPRKLKKPDAERAWKKAAKKVLPEKIIAAAKRYADMRAGEDDRYTAHAASWLNAERFNDPDLQPRLARPEKYVYHAGGIVR